MSKPSKKRPQPSVAKPKATTTDVLESSAKVSSQARAEAVSSKDTIEIPESSQAGFELIRFDRRTKWYMGIVTGLFCFYPF